MWENGNEVIKLNIQIIDLVTEELALFNSRDNE